MPADTTARPGHSHSVHNSPPFRPRHPHPYHTPANANPIDHAGSHSKGIPNRDCLTRWGAAHPKEGADAASVAPWRLLCCRRRRRRRSWMGSCAHTFRRCHLYCTKYFLAISVPRTVTLATVPGYQPRDGQEGVVIFFNSNTINVRPSIPHRRRQQQSVSHAWQ